MKITRIFDTINWLIFDPFKKWRFNARDYKYIGNLLNSVKRRDVLDKKIVINIVRDYKRVIDSEIYLGALLALNGADVKILIDDGVLEHWDTFQEGYPPKLENIDKVNHNPYYHFKKNKNILSYFFRESGNKRAYDAFKVDGLEYIYYSDMINHDNVDFTYADEVKKFAESSTIRYFKSSDLDYNNKYIKYFYYLSLRNALLSRNVGEHVFKSLKPDYFITSHGIYSTYGPAFDYLKKKGMNCLVYGGINMHSNVSDGVFFSDTSIMQLAGSKYWDAYKNTPVTEEMENRVEDYFKARITYSTADVKILFKGKTNLYEINKNEGYKYHIVMFPNIIWDGNVRDRHVVFDDYLEWLILTIKYFQNNNEIKLYVKAHPGEEAFDFFKTTPKVCDLLEQKLDISKYPNVELIRPDKKIDTYKFLMSGIDVALCYDNFLSVEIPYMKIPVIMCVPNGNFAVEDGNYVIKEKAEYFKKLDNIETLIKDFRDTYDSRYKNITRYLYWYLYDNPIQLPKIDAKRDGGRRDFLVLSQKDLLLNDKFLNLFN